MFLNRYGPELRVVCSYGAATRSAGEGTSDPPPNVSFVKILGIDTGTAACRWGVDVHEHDERRGAPNDGLRTLVRRLELTRGAVALGSPYLAWRRRRCRWHEHSSALQTVVGPAGRTSR